MCQNQLDPAPRARSLARISEISLAAPAYNEAENIEAIVSLLAFASLVEPIRDCRV